MAFHLEVELTSFISTDLRSDNWQTASRLSNLSECVCAA